MVDTILYWNVRGLGSLKKRLKSLLMKNDVSICAIAKPFARENCMTTMGNFLSLNYFFSNQIVGGKLWIFWKDSDVFQVLSCTPQMIIGWLLLANQRVLLTFVLCQMYVY